MKWQEKVRAFQASRRISWRALADLVGISNTALAAALESDKAWETVRTAVRLAQEMGTTVEDLFDPKTDWPPEPLIRPASQEERQLAIEALERIAAGARPGASPSGKKRARKGGRRSK